MNESDIQYLGIPAESEGLAIRACSKCSASKPLSEYYKQKSCSAGHMAQCKECTKAASIRHRAANLEAARAYDRQRSGLPHRVEALQEIDRKRRKNPERIAAYKAAVEKEKITHPEKYLARYTLSNAVKAGTVIPWPRCAMPDCTCEDKPHAHHPDYFAPLAVVWLCHSHHKAAHKLARELHRAASTTKE